MSVEAIRVSPGWLDLREGADAAARARELVGHLRRRLPACGPWVIHDLACGSGSMGRWLAPLLPGPQRWVLHDRDADLLALAAADLPGPAVDGAVVAVETRLSDITQLGREDLAGATLVTASALLDLLTGDELAALLRACAGAGCPVLFALSVTGRVHLSPADQLDSRVAAAFDAHQRRTTPRGRLLGPDAVEAAVQGFRRLGAEVVVRPSPWRLGPAEAGLAVEWLTGWIGAACEHDGCLAADADLYRRRRLKEAEAGRLDATIGHADLLVLP
jgi:hypothetical protein